MASERTEEDLTMLITFEQIEQEVFQIVSEVMNTDIERITPKTTFDELSADSLDTVDMIMEVEDTFGITVKDEDADKFQSVGQIIDHIKELV